MPELEPTPRSPEEPEPTPRMPPPRSGGGANPPGPTVVSWSHTPNPPAGRAAQDLTEEERRRAEQAWRETWKATVLEFVAALRRGDIDVDLDLFDWSSRGVDWTEWGPSRIRSWPCTLVLVNAAWRAAWEDTNAPTAGAGAVAEARELRGMFTRDRDDFDRRVVVVVLPGASEDDVPNQLRLLQRRVVTDLSPEGVADLRALLTGQAAHPVPPLGTSLGPPVPILPPDVVERIERKPAVAAAAAAMSATSTLGAALAVPRAGSSVAAAAAVMSATSTLGAASAVRSTGSGTAGLRLGAGLGTASNAGSGAASIELSAHGGAAPVTPSGVASIELSAGSAQGLREDTALVDAVLRALAEPSATSPEREGERHRLQQLREQLAAALVEVDRLGVVLTDAATAGKNTSSTTPTAGAPALSSQEVDQQVAALLEQVEAGLELTDQCWLVLAAVLDSPRASREAGQEPRVVRERLARAVADWVGSTSPPVPVTNPDTTSRDGRTVVFPGTAPTVEESASTSQMWRLEVDPTSGAAVTAGVVSGQVQLQGVTGTGFPSPLQVGERALVLPVRLEMLELWLLCQLQMLAAVLSNADDGSACAGADCAAVHLRATLLSPPALTHLDVEAGVDHLQGQWLRLVAEHRDQDEQARSDVVVAGSKAQAVGKPIVTDVLATTLDQLQAPTTLVATARDLALDLIGHFGVENTIVLRPPPYAQTASEGGELPVDALRAPQAWQQLTHQHARALGLPVDAEEDSPAQRRTRYTEAVDEARRTILRRGSRP